MLLFCNESLFPSQTDAVILRQVGGVQERRSSVAPAVAVHDWGFGGCLRVHTSVGYGFCKRRGALPRRRTKPWVRKV